MRPVPHWLEPFALDLWRTELPDYLLEQISSQFYCGGTGTINATIASFRPEQGFAISTFAVELACVRGHKLF
jgi:hypothetical protein